MRTICSRQQQQQGQGRRQRQQQQQGVERRTRMVMQSQGLVVPWLMGHQTVMMRGQQQMQVVVVVVVAVVELEAKMRQQQQQQQGRVLSFSSSGQTSGWTTRCLGKSIQLASRTTTRNEGSQLVLQG
jgi:hypothetical protein